MKILKKIGIGLVVLIVLVLIVAAFLKKEYGVEREIVINKPKAEVFNYIKLLKNQDNYSVWVRRDPAIKKSFSGTDGTVGAVASWKSKRDDVGEGEQEITKIDEGNRIDMELRFKVPFEATDYAYMITEEVSPTQTRVKWGFNGKMAYPFNLMLLCMDMEGMLGGDLAKGLSDLKVILEK